MTRPSSIIIFFTGGVKVLQRRPFDDKVFGADDEDLVEEGVVRHERLGHARRLAVSDGALVEHDGHLQQQATTQQPNHPVETPSDMKGRAASSAIGRVPGGPFSNREQRHACTLQEGRKKEKQSGKETIKTRTQSPNSQLDRGAFYRRGN